MGCCFLPGERRQFRNLDYDERIPPILADAGVGREKWAAIVKSVEEELFPAVADLIELKNAKFHDHTDLGGCHIAPVIAHSNATMVGANVLARATCLLSSHHGILPQLLVEEWHPFEKCKRAKMMNSDSTDYIYLSTLKFSLPRGIEFTSVTFPSEVGGEETDAPVAVAVPLPVTY